jgi:hypothetical protein
MEDKKKYLLTEEWILMMLLENIAPNDYIEAQT